MSALSAICEKRISASAPYVPTLDEASNPMKVKPNWDVEFYSR